MIGAIKVYRPDNPGWLYVDVSHEAAVRARVFTTEERIAFALKVANACTLDVWVVMHVRAKRGHANDGFVATLVLAR